MPVNKRCQQGAHDDRVAILANVRDFRSVSATWTTGIELKDEDGNSPKGWVPHFGARKDPSCRGVRRVWVFPFLGVDTETISHSTYVLRSAAYTVQGPIIVENFRVNTSLYTQNDSHFVRVSGSTLRKRERSHCEFHVGEVVLKRDDRR